MSGGKITVINLITKPVPAKLPRILVYLPPELKLDIEKLAALEHRSVSNKVLVLIEEEVKKAKQEGKI